MATENRTDRKAATVKLTQWLRSILTASPNDEDLGLFGDYRIQGILGHGGMGVVVKAYEPSLDRPVALKLILPEIAQRSDARERFFREARAAAAVVHPRIVPIFAVGEVNGILFLAMPLLEGRTLGALLKERGRLSISEALRLAREAAEGLGAAHAKGLIHRDVKPDNIWLEETAEGLHVRLLDFGLARGGTAQAITQDELAVGTPHYMAPEQAAGQAPDPKFDLFSMGCVIYEILSGKKAFDGPNLVAVLSAVTNHHPPSLSSIDATIPLSVSSLVAELLEKAPQRRLASAAQLAARLRQMEGEHLDPDATVCSSVVGGKYLKRRIILPTTAILGIGLMFWLVQGIWTKPGNDGPQSPLAMPAPAVESVPKNEPFIKSFQIQHFERVNARSALDRGILGQHSFGARLGDQVTIDVQFNAPTYAYLVAFRPDGVMELIYPDSEAEAPSRSDRVRYPAEGILDVRYGLQEGAGLWVFAVATSDQPLVIFKNWSEEKPTRWKPTLAPAGVVWNHTETGLEALTANGSSRVANGTTSSAADSLRQAIDYLKTKSRATFAAGQGINVDGPR